MFFANIIKAVRWLLVGVGIIIGAMPAIVWAQSALPSVPPPLPSTFYGTVIADEGQSGQTITAVINGTAVATAAIVQQGGRAVYTIKISGDDPATEVIEGGQAGDLIYWQIDGKLIQETAVWQSGANHQLNLALSPTIMTMAPVTTSTSGLLPLLVAVGMILLGFGLLHQQRWQLPVA